MQSEQKTRICPYMKYNPKTNDEWNKYLCVIGSQIYKDEVPCVWFTYGGIRSFSEVCPRGHDFYEIEMSIYELMKIYEPEKAKEVPLCSICGQPILVDFNEHCVNGKSLCNKHYARLTEIWWGASP